MKISCDYRIFHASRHSRPPGIFATLPVRIKAKDTDTTEDPPEHDQFPWKISSPKTFKITNFTAPTYKSYFTKFSHHWFSGGDKAIKYTEKTPKITYWSAFFKGLFDGFVFVVEKRGKGCFQGGLC